MKPAIQPQKHTCGYDISRCSQGMSVRGNERASPSRGNQKLPAGIAGGMVFQAKEGESWMCLRRRRKATAVEHGEEEDDGVPGPGEAGRWAGGGHERLCVTWFRIWIFSWVHAVLIKEVTLLGARV